MAEPSDLIGAWRDLAAELGRAAGAVAGQATGGRDVLKPLQRQAELIESVLRRQIELEQQLVGRALAPAQATMDALDNAPAAMRAQATAFRAAATSFSQAAELLDLQATTLEQALAAIRAPARLAQRGLRAARRDDG